MKALDIKNKKFGRLTGVMFTHNKDKISYWLFKCECGHMKVIGKSVVIRGIVVSCGCYMRQKNGSRRRTHGMSGTRIYNIYKKIQARCNNEKDYAFKWYGGRGIKCLWKSFDEFYKDMSVGYNDTLTVDRIDFNSNYCKENCRWITIKEQQTNKRSNIYLNYEGEKKTVSQWAEHLKVPPERLRYRIGANWSIEDAFNKKKGKYVRK